jgi:carboxylesterase
MTSQTVPPLPAVLPEAEPLSLPARPELTGGRRIGVLLSHGFTGSPASIRPWGEALAERGYAVEVPRLPGHGLAGTDGRDGWREMNRTGWADWYGEVRMHLEGLLESCELVVLGGLSMGGALVLRLAADAASIPGGDRIAGVIVVNPAVASRRLDAKLLPVMKYLVAGLKGIGADIKKPGADEYAYSHTPLRAAHEMFRAWPALVRDLPQIAIPLLYFRSAEDHVVDELSEQVILRRIGTEDITMTRLHESYHVATIDHDAPQIYAESADFVHRVTSA